MKISKLIVGLLCMNSLLFSAILRAEAAFKAGFPHIQPDVDAGKVQTAEQYILLIHLLRPLTTYTNNGEVIGDLAESWKISSDFKSYTFKIRSGQRFSNGDEITADDAARTLRKRMEQNYAVHYDFSKFDKIEVSDKYTLNVSLKEADPFFIYELDHPEFRPIHKTDLVPGNQNPLEITSGFYYIKERALNLFILQANLHALQRFDGPKTVSLSYLPKSKDPKADTEKFLAADFDLIWSPRFADIEPLIAKGYESHRPRLGFTFFISMNTDTIDQRNRRYIQKILDPRNFTYKDKWRKKPAIQLYLPNGPGRIKDSDAEEIWNSIKKSSEIDVKGRQLKMLMPSVFELSDEIIAKLTNAGFRPIVKVYQDFNEYANEIRSSTYDLVLSNNDFSSIDLRGNIAVTFNEERPLILTSKKGDEVSNLINRIVKETDADARNSSVRDLGRILIKDSYIVPIYYHEVLVLAKPGLDLTAWSQIVPEIGIWKVKKLKK